MVPQRDVVRDDPGDAARKGKVTQLLEERQENLLEVAVRLRSSLLGIPQ